MNVHHDFVLSSQNGMNITFIN